MVPTLGYLDPHRLGIGMRIIIRTEPTKELELLKGIVAYYSKGAHPRLKEISPAPQSVLTTEGRGARGQTAALQLLGAFDDSTIGASKTSEA